MHRPSPRTNRPRRRLQTGTGLIELMIALVIGLLISVVAIASLAHARLAAAAATESARLHQDAASVLRIIEQHVRQAGARSLHNVAGGAQVEFGPVPEDEPPRSVDGTPGSGGKPDRLRVGMDADATVDALDCLGNAPRGTRIQSAFELVGGNLRCRGSGHDDPAPLIEGVEDFQVWYAVRQGNQVQYQEAPADWALVRGVKVCLRWVGQAPGGSRRQPLRGCRDETLADDGRLRRVLFRVIHLRSDPS